MPTSSLRLHARSYAYREAADALYALADASNDHLEADELERVASKLSAEYDRLRTLARKRRKKEQENEKEST